MKSDRLILFSKVLSILLTVLVFSSCAGDVKTSPPPKVHLLKQLLNPQFTDTEEILDAEYDEELAAVKYTDENAVQEKHFTFFGNEYELTYKGSGRYELSDLRVQNYTVQVDDFYRKGLWYVEFDEKTGEIVRLYMPYEGTEKSEEDYISTILLLVGDRVNISEMNKKVKTRVSVQEERGSYSEKREGFITEIKENEKIVTYEFIYTTESNGFGLEKRVAATFAVSAGNIGLQIIEGNSSPRQVNADKELLEDTVRAFVDEKKQNGIRIKNISFSSWEIWEYNEKDYVHVTAEIEFSYGLFGKNDTEIVVIAIEL